MSGDQVTSSQLAGTTSPQLNTTEDYGLQNSTEPIFLEPEADQRVEAIIVPILFAIIFFAGVIGNGALIFTILKNKSMRNTPNIFVMNLSIGDMVLLLCSVPFTSTVYTVTAWPYGEFICKINDYIQTLSVGVSIFTLTALSGDRYIAIVHPMSKHTGKPTLITVVTVAVIWFLAILFAIPDGYTATVEYVPGYIDSNGTDVSYGKIPICLPYSFELPTWYKEAHIIFKFVVFFLIPLLIIGLFYVMMAQILIISSRAMPCETMTNSMMNQQQRRQVEARHKVAKVVLSFVLIFVVCWLPRHVYLLFYYFSDEEYNMFWHVFKVTGFCFTYIYSCVNPYALYFLSSQYRKYYNRYLFCCCSKYRYRSLGHEQSTLYNFNSTVRRGSTTLTGVVHSQSMC